MEEEPRSRRKAVILSLDETLPVISGFCARMSGWSHEVMFACKEEMPRI